MKPKVLSNIAPSAEILDLDEFQPFPGQNPLGVVDIRRPIDSSEPVFQVLRECAIKNGMFPRLLRGQAGAYNMADFLVTSGSISTHTDPKLGTVLTWLVDARQNPLTPCGQEGMATELITEYGVLGLRVGDLFVFNANTRHALLTNHACIFAQTQVGLKRKANNQ